MLWHRQAIFESKGARLSSSAECRIRTQGLWNRFSNRLWIPAGKVTELYCDLSNCALAAENANSNRRNILFGSTLIWAAYIWLNDNIALHTGSQPSTRLHHLALDIKIEIKFIWLAGNVSLLLWHHNHQINWSRNNITESFPYLVPKTPLLTFWPWLPPDRRERPAVYPLVGHEYGHGDHYHHHHHLQYPHLHRSHRATSHSICSCAGNTLQGWF